jgi:chromosome segregation ATPase
MDTSPSDYRDKFFLVPTLLSTVGYWYLIKPSTDQLVATLRRADVTMDKAEDYIGDYSQQLQTIMAVSDRALDMTQRTENIAQRLRHRIDEISKNIDGLTTKEISQRLSKVNVDVTELQAQLDVLRKIINPENAQDILSVARMAEEIQTRENFTKTVNSTLLSYERKSEETDDRITQLQYWIWGVLVTIILAMVGAIAVLGREYLSRPSPTKIADMR